MNPPGPTDDFELAGTVIAERFSVDSPIAEGGFGLVYRGTHLGFDRPVAIKCLRVPRELTGDKREAFLRQFDDEGRLLFELSNLHAGIVRAIETGTVRSPKSGDVPYLVLEWLDGESLERTMERRAAAGHAALSLPEIVENLEPVAQALAAAHERGVVHRDVKPSNIVFAEVMGKRTAKILDFGIAKVMHEAWSVTSAKTSRAAGSIGMFTPAYAAPEQWVTRFGATGPWTDVFSFALVCVELLTGGPALEGPTIPNFMGQCIDDEFRPTPRTRGGEVPDPVEEIFAKALAVEPVERHEDVGQFWRELTDAARGMKTDGTQRFSLAPVVGHETTIYGAPLSSRASPRTSPVAQPARGRPGAFPRGAAMLAIAAVLLVVASGGAYFLVRGAEQEVVRARAPADASSAMFEPPSAELDEADIQRGPLPAGWLTVVCKPYCSDIALDGRSLGPSPVLAASVAPGRREIAMRREGTPPKVMRVFVNAGTSREISVSMDP